MVVVGETTPDQEWQIINDDESFWQEDRSLPEGKTDLEQCEREKREQKNLRILEWMYNLPIGEQEGKTKQQVDLSAAEFIEDGYPSFGWIATEATSSSRSSDLEIYIFVWEWKI